MLAAAIGIMIVQADDTQLTKSKTMQSKQNSPFFTELGRILNLIRNISTELNAEMKIEDSKNGRLFDIMHTRDASIEKLQNRLRELEAEIEYFFTENGLRRTIENRFNTQALKHKFSNAFKALSKEYFMLKPDSLAKEQQDTNEEAAGSVA